MRKWAVALTLAAAFGVVGACREPTQMTVRIVTEQGLRCPELKRVVVIVGPSPQEVEARSTTTYTNVDTTQCESDTSLGSLVVTPDGDRGAVMVIAQVTDAPCKAPGFENCIVARRSFGFLKHVKEEMPIALSPDCLNLPCGVLESCHRGACVSSEVTCNDDGACTTPADGTAPPVSIRDGGDDHGDASHDASSDGNAEIDASVDGSTDGSTGKDGSVKGVTNFCPPDSHTACGDFCCIPVSGNPQPIACEAPCTGGHYTLLCTGAEKCGANQFCCWNSTGNGQYASDCKLFDDCAGAQFFCGSADDCPTTQLPYCKPTGPMLAGHIAGVCSSTP